MDFRYILALHIIFVVTWFAGLFYIVRLFIYHVEAEELPAAEKHILQKQYKIMESRLWYAITYPSMFLTFIFGFWLLYLLNFWTLPWIHLKLAFVFALVLYHIRCGMIFKNLQRDNIAYTSFGLRLWNEGATLLLFAIVFIVIFKDIFSVWWGMLGLIIIGTLFFIVAKAYKKVREKNSEKKEVKSEKIEVKSKKRKEGNE